MTDPRWRLAHDIDAVQCLVAFVDDVTGWAVVRTDTVPQKVLSPGEFVHPVIQDRMSWCVGDAGTFELHIPGEAPHEIVLTPPRWVGSEEAVGPSLLEAIQRFARKERAWVVQYLSGSGDRLRLAESARSELSSALGEAIPKRAYVTTDYHLDWLIGAVHLANGREVGSVIPNLDRAMTGSQQDIDVLVAWEGHRDTRLVLVEAKGVGRWDTAQLKSKCRRIEVVAELARDLPLEISVLLLSPVPPSNKVMDAVRDAAPQVGRIEHVVLPLPDGLRRIERCTIAGVPSAAGDHVRILETPPTLTD